MSIGPKRAARITFLALLLVIIAATVSATVGFNRLFVLLLFLCGPLGFWHGRLSHRARMEAK